MGTQSITRWLKLIAAASFALYGCGGGSGGSGFGGSGGDITPQIALLAGTFDATTVPLEQDGQGSAAGFVFPNSIATDSQGNVFVLDGPVSLFNSSSTIRRIWPSGQVSTFATLDNTATEYLAADGLGNVYTFEQFVICAGPGCYVSRSELIKVNSDGVVSYVGSIDPTAPLGPSYHPTGIAATAAGEVFVMDASAGLIQISPTGQASTVLDLTASPLADPTGQHLDVALDDGLAMDASGNAYIPVRLKPSSGQGQILQYIAKISPQGVVSWIPAGAASATTWGIAVNARGDVYLSGQPDGSTGSQITQVTPSGVVTTLAGSSIWGRSDGTGTAASFSGYCPIALDRQGNLWVADSGNSVVRTVAATGMVSTAAGATPDFEHDDGVSTAARFSYPSRMAADPAGNLYVVDGVNPLVSGASGSGVRKVTPAGVVSTVMGRPATLSDWMSRSYGPYRPASYQPGSYYWLSSIAVDGWGNVFVTDGLSIYKTTPAGVESSFAGGGSSGQGDGAGVDASFAGIRGMAVDSDNNLWVTDANDTADACAPQSLGSSNKVCTFSNASIRKISPQGVVSTVYKFPAFTMTFGPNDVPNFSQFVPLCMRPDGTVATTSFATTSGGQQSVNVLDPSGTPAVMTHVPIAPNNGLGQLTCDSTGNIYVTAITTDTSLFKIDPAGIVTPVNVKSNGTSATVAGVAKSPLASIAGMVKVGTSLYFTSGNGVGVVTNVP